ncbi:MAG TPA: YciI family protein [Candidatus Dormibacteraeota bacterium]|jgi:hypothetical protein|nr:YciI family protein [Candidatus Dormibacteraeota bacterium]
MNQYMLSVYSLDGEPEPTEDEMKKIYKDVDDFNAELKSAGGWVFAGGLHPHTTATTVQVKDGDVLTTDGPFAEGKEHIGGFWVIQAEDLDAALAWASKATVACAGPVEVRPFEAEAG